MTSTEQIEVEKCFTCKYDTFTDSKKKKRYLEKGSREREGETEWEGIEKEEMEETIKIDR